MNASDVLLDGDILNFTEAVALLKIPAGTLRNYCSQRQVPYYRVGRGSFFRRSELTAWFTSHRREPSAASIEA